MKYVIMTEIEQFSRLIRIRSYEHKSVGILLFENHHYGQLISVLRQELDSLVRVIFLLSENLNTRTHLISLTLQDYRWTLPNSKTLVTDREMVNLSNKLNGWTNSVYKLGCAFIHLTSMIDYENSNPFNKLEKQEIENIKIHMHNYHGFHMSNELNMSTVSPFLLSILDKVSNNLEYYLIKLEENINMDVQNL